MSLATRLANSLKKSFTPVFTSNTKTILTSQRGIAGGGFTYPAPRSLDAIVNYDLFAAEPAEAIKEIWTEHHKSMQTCMATVIKASDFDTLKVRASNSPFFAIPVQRESGHFVLLANYQDKSFIFTYLEDYNRDPANAPPYLAVTAYEELSKSKDIVLLRADICALATLTQADAKRLMEQVITFYADDSYFPYVYSFNKEPRTFDFEEAFKAANEMPAYEMPVFEEKA